MIELEIFVNSFGNNIDMIKIKSHNPTVATLIEAYHEKTHIDLNQIRFNYLHYHFDKA